jgi:hypothetical protein
LCTSSEHKKYSAIVSSPHIVPQTLQDWVIPPKSQVIEDEDGLEKPKVFYW